MTQAYRVHGVDVVSEYARAPWQRVEIPQQPWRLILEMPKPALAEEVPPRSGPARTCWRQDGPRLVLEMTGTPWGCPTSTASAARLTTDPVQREIRVEHTHDRPEDSVDLVARWLLPQIAREEHDLLPLHACAVTTDMGAVLLLGDTGAGKSALATAMLATGADLIGDEPLCVRDGFVWPGPRILRGNPELMKTLLNVDAPLDELGKAVLGATSDMPHSWPVAALVALSPRRHTGDLVTIKRPPAAESLTRLMSLRYARPHGHLAEDLPRAGRVVRSTPVLEVSLRDDLGSIIPAAEIVLAAVRAARC